MLLSANKKQDVASIIKSIQHRYMDQHLPPNHSISALIVGMPNVGKSTLINSLKNYGMYLDNHKKAVKTGKLPGVTKSLSGKVKILQAPLFYVIDSPGIMLPHIKEKEIAMKMALSGTSIIIHSIFISYHITSFLYIYVFRSNC